MHALRQVTQSKYKGIRAKNQVKKRQPKGVQKSNGNQKFTEEPREQQRQAPREQQKHKPTEQRRPLGQKGSGIGL